MSIRREDVERSEFVIQERRFRMEGNIEGVKNDLRAIGVDSVTDEIAKDLMALVFDFHEAGYFITEKKLIRAIGTMTWGEKRTLYFDNH